MIDPLTGLRYREGTYDLNIIREAYRSYRRLRGTHVLDVGANIGATSRYLLDVAGVKRVTGVEPDPDNARLYRANVPEAQLFEAAVIDGNARRIPFYTHARKNRATLGTIPRVGFEQTYVRAVPWRKLLRLNVDAVKCDIEGAEYELDWEALPSRVHTVVVELHMLAVDPMRDLPLALIRTLRGMGFTSRTNRNITTRGNWPQVWSFHR
jgi:FkbM family methyltransferase